MKNYFNTNLKYIRERILKLSQNKFSEYINVNQSNVARWEDGSRTPSIDAVIDISEKVNIPLDALVGKDLRLEDENYQQIPNKDFADEIADILKNSNLSQKKQEKILSDIEFYREDE